MTARLTWAEFWPFYLKEHNNRRNRITHAVGTTVAVGFVVAAIGASQPWFLLAGLVAGYAFAWFGHGVFQKNRPATFRYPIKSFLSDWRLWAVTLMGRAPAEYAAHGIEEA